MILLSEVPVQDGVLPDTMLFDRSYLHTSHKYQQPFDLVKMNYCIINICICRTPVEI